VPPSLTLPRAVGVVAIGVVVGLVGTGVHRANQPTGVIIALAIAASAGVMVRAWARWAGVVLLAGVLALVIVVLAGVDRGGDVVIAAQRISYVWFASVPVVLATMALPRAWFSDRQVGGGADRERLAP
jgi:hypothetical protein